MVEDRLKVARFERRLRYIDRVNSMMKERGLSSPTRQLPINIGLPLLSHATLEEDNELQDRWAALLVNATDIDSRTELRRAFISILSDLTATDAAILDMIAASPNGTAKAVCVGPGVSVIHASVDPLPPPSEQAMIALSNLARLGCIGLQSTWDGGVSYEDVSVTPLGAAFVKACTTPRKQ